MTIYKLIAADSPHSIRSLGGQRRSGSKPRLRMSTYFPRFATRVAGPLRNPTSFQGSAGFGVRTRQERRSWGCWGRRRSISNILTPAHDDLRASCDLRKCKEQILPSRSVTARCDIQAEISQLLSCLTLRLVLQQ